MEKWRNEKSKTPKLQHSNHPPRAAFALYEVLLGVTIFALGVLVIGRSMQNCLNASSLSAEEDRARQILSNRMAEVQTSPGHPDAVREFQIHTGSGVVRLIQKSGQAQLKGENNVDLTGINRVILRAEWQHAGRTEAEQIEFYVYRRG